MHRPALMAGDDRRSLLPWRVLVHEAGSAVAWSSATEPSDTLTSADVTYRYKLLNRMTMQEDQHPKLLTDELLAPSMPSIAALERKLMLQRHHMHAGPDVMCKCTKTLDRITEIKGMALAWCDCGVLAEPTPDGLAFEVSGECTTTIDGEIYTLQKVCLLLPSTHRLRRDPSPLEVQFVHEARCGDRLVLAALFREGEPDFHVNAAIESLLSEQARIRLIDLLPLSRYFFTHDVSHSDQRRPFRKKHMVSASEMVISSAHLADLYARLSIH